jgi:Ca2+-binding EF-hand superfamily protein
MEALMKIHSLILISALALATPAMAAKMPAAFDPDKDGTMDLAEAKAAAGALFDKLEKDKDGTLEIKELQGRLSKVDFGGADPDADKTLTRDEFMAVVEQRFNAANTDGDGTLDAKELNSKEGKALKKLLK